MTAPLILSGVGLDGFNKQEDIAFLLSCVVGSLQEQEVMNDQDVMNDWGWGNEGGGGWIRGGKQGEEQQKDEGKEEEEEEKNGKDEEEGVMETKPAESYCCAVSQPISIHHRSKVISAKSFMSDWVNPDFPPGFVPSEKHRHKNNKQLADGTHFLSVVSSFLDTKMVTMHSSIKEFLKLSK